METIDMDKIWLLEWSNKQRCFHVETVAEMQKRNLEMFMESALTDFVPIAVGPTIHDVNLICEALKRKMEELHGDEWRETHHTP